VKGKKLYVEEFAKANDIIKIMLISILNEYLISLPDYGRLMLSTR
jgi:hypothetical protein